VRIKAPGTDITLGVAAATGIPWVGEHNMPDASSSPPRRGLGQRRISFSFPESYGGRTVSGVRLRFEDGEVVDATAGRGRGVPGRDARHRSRRRAGLGEIGSAQLRHRHATKEILLDEKICGDGAHGGRDELPRDGRHEQLGVHWDMVCDLREA